MKSQPRPPQDDNKGHFGRRPPPVAGTAFQRVHDESPRWQSPLEWWFIQGYFAGRSIPRQYFMASLFRHELPTAAASGRRAFSLLLSQLDTKTGAQSAESWADPLLIGSSQRAPAGNGKSNLHPFFEDIFFKELRQSGPPRSIKATRGRPLLKPGPLSVHWDGFSLVQKTGRFLLSMKSPREGRRCAFELVPRRERWQVEAARQEEPAVCPLEYASYPRLRLQGKAGGVAVSGEAWFDHQWGPYDQLASGNGKKRMRGWEWFGINLDDGSDWIVMAHRDAETRQACVQYVSRRDRSGHVRTARIFELLPGRLWESPRTAIRYPVEWRILAPELEADLRFIPEADDQEVPVFGLMRALWEGAGRVSGTVAGRAVKGRARCELHGYGYIFSFRDYLKAMSERVDRHLEHFLPKTMSEKKIGEYIGPAVWQHDPAAQTEMLSRPVWDLVRRGGKRWRPAFSLLLLDALGRDTAPFEAMICALAELCHTGSLIIDDIEDSSLLRRGEPCIHIRYGLDTAINAANSLYFLPSLLIFDHPLLSPRQRLQIHEVMTRQYVRAHFGQAMDLFWSRNMSAANLRAWMSDSMAAKILQMYELKTAAPLEALAETAAIVAGSPPALRRNCVRFAQALGVAFQITDDVRNFMASPRQKKTLGEDLSEGKLTFVMYQALKKAAPAARRRLQQIASSGTLRRDPAALREGIAIIAGSGALESCRREAEKLVQGMWQPLARQLPSCDAKILLQTLQLHLLDLGFDA
jgi:geranylgeranyl pyrophosphate synthase/predicted secreted hydrolase